MILKILFYRVFLRTSEILEPWKNTVKSFVVMSLNKAPVRVPLSTTANYRYMGTFDICTRKIFTQKIFLLGNA